MGVVVAPLCFWLYWTAFDVGVPGTVGEVVGES